MLLSLDGTQPHFSWCLSQQKETIASESLHLEHYEQLPDYLKTKFKNLGVKPEEIKRLAIILGPGNYTGLRTSISFVRTWHMLYQTPVVCKNRLETMLYALAGEKIVKPIWISQFVRMQQYFILQAQITPKLVILTPLQKVDQTAWKTHVKGIVYGEAPSSYDQLIEHPAWNHLAPVLAKWAEKEAHFSPLHEITPFYTRAAVAK